MIKLFTIGFTKKNAKAFFNLLINNKVKRIIDIRLHNSSQLAGFTKAEDLKYFAKAVGNIEYIYKPEFAPSEELITKYRKKEISWEQYETEYFKLLRRRKPQFNFREFHRGCLLCSEDAPDKCHRRLLAEYLQKINNEIKIIHLQ